MNSEIKVIITVSIVADLSISGESSYFRAPDWKRLLSFLKNIKSSCLIHQSKEVLLKIFENFGLRFFFKQKI